MTKETKLEKYLLKRIEETKKGADRGRRVNDIALINVYKGETQALSKTLKYIRSIKYKGSQCD